MRKASPPRARTGVAARVVRAPRAVPRAPCPVLCAPCNRVARAPCIVQSNRRGGREGAHARARARTRAFRALTVARHCAHHERTRTAPTRSGERAPDGYGEALARRHDYGILPGMHDGTSPHLSG